MTKSIQIAVRDFARPTIQLGSIDMYSGYNQGKLQSGAEIHSLFQNRLVREIEGYEKEVTLKHSFQGKRFRVDVSGRIDGLVTAKSGIIIEEIKSTGSVEKLAKSLDGAWEHPYRLQVLVYAYIYKQLFSLTPDVQLRLVSSLTLQDTVYPVEFNEEKLQKFVENRVSEIELDKINTLKKLVTQRAAAHRLVFPFASMRKGQQQLIDHAAHLAQHAKHGLLQAPTGLGKTAGILFPSLKNALRRGKQVIYVTPKNSQQALVRETVMKLQEKVPNVRSSTLIAKKKVCMQDEPLCTPEHCKYAQDYYEKVSKNKVLEKLQMENNLDFDVYKKYAEEFEVCPFELSLAASLSTDVVVCDYNYIFSPRAAFAQLFLDDERPKKPNLVIDEVHNLPQRACDYFSPEIGTSYLQELKERGEEIPPILRHRYRKLVGECIQCLHSEKTKEMKAGDRKVIDPEAGLFLELEGRIQSFCVQYFEKIESLPEDDCVTDLGRYWSNFCAVLGTEGDEFFTTYRCFSGGDSIKITCCDASKSLSETLKNFHAVIAFSATVKPFEYYANMCGFNREIFEVSEFESPFAKDKRKVLVIPQVSTKFRDRERNYPKIGDAISRIIQIHRGNYLAFFPSYQFLEKTAHHIRALQYNVHQQKRNQSRRDFEELIDELKASNNNLILAVQGGVLAEGVDYPGELVIGAIVVGPGLPNFEFERELLRRYYDHRYGAGFDYAYTYPAMVRVVQSAGRVIRTEGDVGLIVLLDKRFSEEKYYSSLPRYWYENSVSELMSTSITKDISDFWKSHEA